LTRYTGWNLPNWPTAGGWFLNPLAWQFIMAIGVAAGLAPGDATGDAAGDAEGVPAGVAAGVCAAILAAAPAPITATPPAIIARRVRREFVCFCGSFMLVVVLHPSCMRRPSRGRSRRARRKGPARE
jgi:hypothetical protein